MVKLLLYKWFGLVDPPCDSCEILRLQLANSEKERRDLLQQLLAKDKPEPTSPAKEEEFVPINPLRIPWRVKQQMLEAEDRKQAQLLKQRAKEIDELEKEVGVK